MPRNENYSIFAEYTLTKQAAMGISLNLIVCALLTVWMVEYFGYNAGREIHVLLLIAGLLFIARLVLLIPVKPRVEVLND